MREDKLYMYISVMHGFHITDDMETDRTYMYVLSDAILPVLLCSRVLAAVEGRTRRSSIRGSQERALGRYYSAAQAPGVEYLIRAVLPVLEIDDRVIQRHSYRVVEHY